MANKEYVYAETRETDLMRRYGMTMLQYNALFMEQGGRCAICGTMECKSGKSLGVDHCHDTGHIRGLLCLACNLGLGKFNDDSALLAKALHYMERNNAKS